MKKLITLSMVFVLLCTATISSYASVRLVKGYSEYKTAGSVLITQVHGYYTPSEADEIEEAIMEPDSLSKYAFGKLLGRVPSYGTIFGAINDLQNYQKADWADEIDDAEDDARAQNKMVKITFNINARANQVYPVVTCSAKVVDFYPLTVPSSSYNLGSVKWIEVDDGMM